jgi:hypothetical protein
MMLITLMPPGDWDQLPVPWQFSVVRPSRVFAAYGHRLVVLMATPRARVHGGSHHSCVLVALGTGAYATVEGIQAPAKASNVSHHPHPFELVTSLVPVAF